MNFQRKKNFYTRKPNIAKLQEKAYSAKTVFLTGGGSGGHVVPVIGIIRKLQRVTNDSLDLVFIGRKQGIERSLLESFVDVYKVLPAGKWRRYKWWHFFSPRNFRDMLHIISACFKAFAYLYPYRKRKGVCHATMFSTGGYVALPPSLMASLLGIPVLIHEQTSRVGLANRMSALLAKKVFLSFRSSKKFFPEKKCEWIGYPLSASIIHRRSTNIYSSKGDIWREENLLDKIPKNKKLLLVTGGGNGSKFINSLIVSNLKSLERNFFILHQTGREHLSEHLRHTSDCYLPVGFVFPQIFGELLYQANIVISRAGAGAVCECIYLNKKALFIPLEIAQRNEQYYNAKEASRVIDCLILREKEVVHKPLIDMLKPLFQPDKRTHEKPHYKDRPNQPASQNKRFLRQDRGMYYQNKDKNRLLLYQNQFKQASELITQNILGEIGISSERRYTNTKFDKNGGGYQHASSNHQRNKRNAPKKYIKRPPGSRGSSSYNNNNTSHTDTVKRNFTSRPKRKTEVL